MEMFQTRGLCPIRLVADLSLAASIPVLAFKLYKTGHKDVSLATQAMLLWVFLARYADLLFGDIHFSLYNDFLKYYFLFGTVALHTAIIGMHVRTKCDCSLPRERRGAIFCALPCLALGYVFNYQSEIFDTEGNLQWYSPNWMEVAWAFSIFLQIFAAVPQLRKFRRAEKKDPLMLAYLALLFASRALLLPHWYIRFQTDGIFDPIAAVSAVYQSTIFLAYIPVFIRDARLKRKEGAIHLQDDTVEVSGDFKGEKVLQGAEAV